MDWIILAQSRSSCRVLMNDVINFQVPINAGNFLSNRGTVSFSRRIVCHGVI